MDKSLVLLFIMSAMVAGLAVAKVDMMAKYSELIRNYEKDISPEGATDVTLGFYFNSFNVDHVGMEFTATFYFRQSWRDKRLEFNPDEVETGKISLGKADGLWVPDTFFRNEKKSEFHDVMVPNRLVRINGTGHVWYVAKLTTTFACPMKFQKFPFDTQMCPLMVESYKYTMDDIKLSWLDSPVDIDTGIQLPHFTLQDAILYDCSGNYTAGSFPCLEVRFVLERDYNSYVLQLYFPSILIVLLICLSFWIPGDFMPARIIVGTLSLLALMALLVVARNLVPRIGYLTAMDNWFIFCLVFGFVAFMEFVFICFCSKKCGKDEDNQGGSVQRVDFVCGLVFPLVFLIFNIIYWPVCLTPVG